jgi:cleavage stimulation factor subunit 3
MTARSSFTELQNITKDLIRTTLPKLPPALGFDGDVEYAKQLEIWNRWIQWEKDDPLVLKDEDIDAYHNRILYVYQQALMALRYWPAMWCEAAEFCFQSSLDKEGGDFLTQGVAANPESCLLTFKLADRIEETTTNEGGPEGVKSRAAAVREPYDKLLDALYDLITKAKAREAQDIARIEANWEESAPKSPVGRGDDDDYDTSGDGQRREAEKNSQIEGLKLSNAVQIQMLSKTISFAWIALMRATRRIGGKGNAGDMPGSRQIFTDARKRGRLTSDVYVASALIEYHCYKDPAATKIFERGMKLFPEDESFALEFLKHLIASNDITSERDTLFLDAYRMPS